MTKDLDILIKYNLYRTFHKGQYGTCGCEYAKLYPNHLLPEELERFKMGRPRGSTNAAKKTVVAKPKKNSQLYEALAFIGVASEDRGFSSNSFCIFEDDYVKMTDGVVTAGYPVEEQIALVPNYEILKKALKQCGDTFSITELETNRISVKGGKLRVLVPCLEAEEYPGTVPDPMIAPIDDRLKHAFACVGKIADENSDQAFKASVLLEANVVTATDTKVLMQYWHGISLPPNLVVPKIFVKAVVSNKAPLVGFGWNSEKSITFWFEGGAWVKTQLYADEYPTFQQVIDVPSNQVPVMPTLFEGIEKAGEFSENGFIYLKDGFVSTNLKDNTGAQYEVEGMASNVICLNVERAKLIAPFVSTVDLTTYTDRVFFFGNNMRGVIIGAIVNEFGND
jgi:hypothetical protein